LNEGKPVPSALAAATVLDASGGSRRLGDTWSVHDAVILFVRHFACAGCAEHVAALRPRLHELARIDVDVVIVGNGSPAQLAAFVEREEVQDVACFTDPTLAAYRAAGLVRSAWGTFGPVAVGQLVRAYMRGFRNGRPQGDLQQQGGTLYVTRAGILAFHHRAANLGDHAPLVDVVDVALAEAAAR
jgi:peroxiredoxin